MSRTILMSEARDRLGDFWMRAAGLLAAALLVMCISSVVPWTMWEMLMPMVAPVTGMVIAARKLTEVGSSTVEWSRFQNARFFSWGYAVAVTLVIFIWPLLLGFGVVPRAPAAGLSTATTIIGFLQGLLIYNLVTFFPTQERS